jgi:Sec-independent protein translocase protein TatA
MADNTGKWVAVVTEDGEPIPAIGDTLVPAHWVGTDLLPPGAKAKGRAVSGARAAADPAKAEAEAAAQRAAEEAAAAEQAAKDAEAQAKADAAAAKRQS